MMALFVLAVGVPLGLLAWGAGRMGAPGVTLAAWAGLLIGGFALWFTVTNDRVPVGDGFDEPVLTGMVVGGIAALFTSPFWIGGYVLGRKARKGNV
ncbi:MAG TPA: hypothetical protein DEO85_14000 [Maritimibacter sp.]|nr:hypothetical protein [Maritimibacter sp.]